MSSNESAHIPAAEAADIMHQASSLYMSANMSRDYGDGKLYTATEVHMLEYIVSHPGKNVTQLSEEWDKTKAALSQMLKKLEQKDMIYHTNAQDNLRKQLYYATEYGLSLNQLHMAYDERVFGETLRRLREYCSEEEIETCFHVLKQYIKVIRAKHYRSRPDET